MRRLRNLINGLPPEARLRSENPDEPWTVLEELVAQMIEEVSILAADRRRKDPKTVPRPQGIEDQREAKAPARTRELDEHGQARYDSGRAVSIPSANMHGGLLAAALTAAPTSVSAEHG